MLRKTAIAALALALYQVPVLLGAAEFAPDSIPAVGQTGQTPRQACGTLTLTHSTSQTVAAMNSVACRSAQGHTDNYYFRAFDLTDFGLSGWFDVCAVEIGVESATGFGGTQPLTVNLYSQPPGFPAGYPGTLVGTADIQVTDQALTVLEIPVTGSVAADQELIVEIFTPDGQADGNSLFIGSNSDPETDPSYVAAADCAFPNPTTTADTGSPDMHIVLNAVGTDRQPNLVPIPTLSGRFLFTLMALLAAAGVFLLRR